MTSTSLPRTSGNTTSAIVSRLLDSVRHRCRYTLPGLWVALVFAVVSFVPSLLPRPALFQGAITGIDAAIGYGFGVRVDGALFVGPPNFNPLYREFVDGRDAGSLEVEPVYRNGRVVRFTNRPRDPIPPVDQPSDGPRVLYMQHPSDPITWWSPDLIWREPDWLEEPRGSDVLEATRWFPVVTFWQLSADLALGFSTEPGHGHNFSGEHVDGWAAVLQPEGWNADRADDLRDIILSSAVD